VSVAKGCLWNRPSKKHSHRTMVLSAG